jgi:hypothetical protein
MVSIADGFGIDLSTAARPALTNAKFKLAYDKSYPIGTQDLAPVVNEIKALNPDVFIAFSYPPDTLALTEQSRIAGFNPKVFYTGVGTAFPLYRQKFGKNTEGVMGIGGWSGDSPAIKDYLARHKASAANGAEPDRWASAVTYASLQMLQQAIERVGKIDRAAVIKDLQTGSFDTVIGKVKLENNMPTRFWWVGQWQDGEFYGIAPAGNEGRAARDRAQAGVGGALTSQQRGRSCHDERHSDRPDAGRHVCAHRHGAHAPVRRCAHHEPLLRRVSDRGCLCLALAVHGLGDQSVCRTGAGRARRLRAEFRDLQGLAHAAGAPRA